MNLVAAALPPTELGRERDVQVLADAEDVIVGVLFDDIVRALVRAPTAFTSEPLPPARPRPKRMGPPPVTAGLQRFRTAWARSPPRGQPTHVQSTHLRKGAQLSRGL
jgi:hypothetical protein